MGATIYVKIGTGPMQVAKLYGKQQSPELGEVIAVKVFPYERYADWVFGLVDAVLPGVAGGGLPLYRLDRRGTFQVGERPKKWQGRR